MVQQLFGDIEKLKAEVARLRGRIDAFSVGGQLIQKSIISGVQIPLPIEGTIIYGTSVPDWARLTPPPGGDDYELEFRNGDVAPSWQIKTSGSQDDVFIIGMAAML